MNCTNFKLFSNCKCTWVVLCEDSTLKSKFRFVRNLDCFFNWRYTDEWQYRTKWFFPSKTHISCYMVKDCWVNKVTFTFQFSFSSSTLFNCIINQTLNEVSSFCIDKWCNACAFFRHTNSDITYQSSYFFYQFICNAIHYKDTFDSCTTLTWIVKGTSNNVFSSQVKISIFKNDSGIFTTKFKHDWTHSCQTTDIFTNWSWTCEVDEINCFVFNDVVTDNRTTTCDRVQDTCRDTSFNKCFNQKKTWDRTLCWWFEGNNVTSNQGRSNFRTSQVYWVVKWRDSKDKTYWFATNNSDFFLATSVKCTTFKYFTFQTQTFFSCIVDDFSSTNNFTDCRFQTFRDFFRKNLTDFFCITFQDICCFMKVSCTFSIWKRTPCWECCFSCCVDFVYFSLAHCWNWSKFLTVCRCIDSNFVFRCFPLTIDIVFVLFSQDSNSFYLL